MKKIVLFSAPFFLTTCVFAQEAKSGLFIGRYNKEKKGICSDRTWVHKEIKDFQEYQQQRKQFYEEHKKDDCATEFVSPNQSVIVYEYQERIPGWACSPVAISLIKGATISQCKEELAIRLEKYANEFKTPPNIIFTWAGTGVSKKEFTKDFGGLTGKFISGNTSTKSIIVAQLNNKTKEKSATVLIKTDDGKMTVDYINPGSTLTKKCDSKTIEVQVIYRDIQDTKQSLTPLEFLKHQVRDMIINENGEIKSKRTFDAVGVRG